MARSGDTDCTPDRPARPPLLERHYLRLIVLLGVLLFVARAALLAQSLRHNPFGVVPIGDAAVYWDAAGAMAAGSWTLGAPFSFPPLYLLFVAAIRRLGGDLEHLFIAQIILHVATAGVIASVARRRFGPAVALLALLLFGLLMEPAYFAVRVLACTLQLFLVCLLWRRLLGLREAVGRLAPATAGLLAGLNCLATPPTVVLLPIVAAWLAAGRGRRGASAAAWMLGPALVVIAPATAHNYRVSGEFIPVQVNAGRTLADGNNAEANGTYSAPAGFSAARDTMLADDRLRLEAGLGRRLGWNEIERLFAGRAFGFWWDHPAAAVRLLALKTYWCLTAHHYGELYLPTLEALDGVLTRLRMSPLPLPWLIAPALVALAPRRVRFVDALLLLLPVLVILVFYYSPRYRFPMTGVVTVLAASAVLDPSGRRLRPRVGPAALVASAAAIGLTTLNGRLDIDSPAEFGEPYALRAAYVYQKAGRFAAAETHLRRLAEVDGPQGMTAAHALAGLLAGQKRWGDVLAFCDARLAAGPGDPVQRLWRGDALAGLGRIDDARVEFERAVHLNPDDPNALLRLGLALKASGRNGEAVAALFRAQSLAERAGVFAAWAEAGAAILAVLADTDRAGEAARLRAEYEAAAVRLGRPDIAARFRAAGVPRVGPSRSPPRTTAPRTNRP